MNANIKVQMEKKENAKEERKRRVHDSTSTDTLQLLHVNYESSRSNNNHDNDMDENDGDSSIETNLELRRSRKRRYSQIRSSDDDDRSVTYKEYISNHSGSSSSSSSSSISSEDDNQDDEDLAIIGTILARKKDTIRNWNKICKDMNTCEIERGSIWHDPSRNPVENELDREETRYLVRWTNCSYIHCSWEIEQDLLEQTSNGEYQLRAFNQQFRESGLRYDVIERNQGAYFDPNYTKIDRILDIQDSQVKNIVFDPSHKDYADGTGRQFLIKWKNTPYGDSTYEHERDLINRKVEFESHVKSYLERIQRPTPQQIKENRIHQERQTRSLYKVLGDTVHPTNDKSEKIADYVRELEQVSYPDGRKLRGYQAEGLAWLIGNYINRRSSILADEMGLGKTISSAAFLQMLFTNFHNRGPFLVIAPLSTLPQWYREMSSWTDLNVIMYTGTSLDKAIIHEFEFPFHSDRPTGLRKNQRYLKNCHRNSSFKKVWMPQIVITSPESFTGKDTCELIDVEWEMLVFDEAHARLKNDQSKLSLALRDEKFLFKHLLLLTGTPIQNNMSELWSILNVIDTTKFGDRDYFIERYGNMRNKDQVEELHSLLRPYILRRLKEDVEKNLPPKEETIIEVELTVLQKQYYRALFEKNIGFLSRGDKGGKRFNNVCMQLRKCCNHPYLLDGVEELVNENQNQETETSNVESLIKASGKLVLLDKLLPKLKEGGHRVLIFSQFKIMLDIIEDYLSHRNFGYERIDGDVTGLHRQQAIDRFQAPESSSFIMMLSTKAGGVGINLTSADTCILFDSDWNPQNDLQAQARCHRIGQTKSVKIYRLLCRKSYEMRLFQLASMKMGLDKVVMNGVENGDTKCTISDEEAERLLRYGAYDVFSEDPGNEREAQRFLEEDIDTILLGRTTTRVQDSGSLNLNFSKAWFKGSDESASNGTTETNDIDVDDPDFWVKILKKGSNNDTHDEDENSFTQERSSVSLCDDTMAEESDTDDHHSINDSDFSITSSTSTDLFHFRSKKEKSLQKREYSSPNRKYAHDQEKKDDKLSTPRAGNGKVFKKIQTIDCHTPFESERTNSSQTTQQKKANSAIDTNGHYHVYHPSSYHGYRPQDHQGISQSLTFEISSQTEAPVSSLERSKKISPSRRESPRKLVKKISSYKEGWICSRCHIELSSEQALNYHMDNMICLQETNKDSLKSENKLINEDRTECPHCMRKFAVAAGLKYHLSKGVCTRNSYQRPKAVVAGASKKEDPGNSSASKNLKPELKCPKCAKTYRLKGRLQSHIDKNMCGSKVNIIRETKATDTTRRRGRTPSKHDSNSLQPSSSNHSIVVSTATKVLSKPRKRKKRVEKKEIEAIKSVSKQNSRKETISTNSRVSLGSDVLSRLLN